ncbi:MAG: DUF748 domain-containing protein [Gammaproteobacteria bacterium]
MNWKAWLHPNKLKQVVLSPRVHKIALGILAAYVVLLATLFFAGPPLIKSLLIDNLSKRLGRHATIGAVHVNPFMLSVTIDDFVLDGPDGKTPFVAFKQLYANAQLASIVFFGPVLREISLTDPRVYLARSADGQYNFQDIVERLQQQVPKAPAKSADAKPMNFSINNIRIINGRIDFDDKEKGRKHEVRDLNVAIPFLSDLFYRIDDYVSPHFSAVVNGAPIQLTGQSKPFQADRESSLDLKLSHVSLGEYLTYVPKKLYFTIPGGTLDANLKLSFLQPPGQSPKLRISGTLDLQDLAVNQAKDVPTLRVKRLNVALGSIEPLTQRFTINRIAVSGADLYVRRDKQGRINLMHLTPPSESKSSAPLPYFLVRDIELKQSTVHVSDKDRPRPFDTSLSNIHLTVQNLTSEKGRTGTVQLSANGPKGATLQASTDVALAPLLVSKLHVKLADLNVTLPGEKSQMMHVGQFTLAGGRVNLDQRRVMVDEITVNKGQLNVGRDRNGRLNLAELAGGGAPQEATAAPESAPSWQYGVKKVHVADLGIHWRDQVPRAGPANVGGEITDAVLDDLSSAPHAAAKLALKARIGRTGNVSVDGDIQLAPLSARLKVDARAVPVLPAQPYFADKVHITVTRGTLSARGSFNADFEPKPKFSYRGNVQVNRFASVDQVRRNDFLNWAGLYFSDVNVTTEPLKVAINAIALNNFYSRLIVNPDGSLNVQHVMGKEPGSKEAVAGEVTTPKKTQKAAAAAARTKNPKPGAAPPVPIKIGRIALKRGRINFTDHFIKPNYSANLSQISGRISGLSSDRRTTASVDLRGKLQNTADVDIKGKINPLAGNLFLDLTASARNIDLPPVTAYSERYAGYPITKGQLSMNVKYHVENGQLKAQNRIILHQLTFGSKVENSTATKLPVLLAVALLKDPNGVIDINLPISGSLNDPNFSVGGIIAKAIVHLLVKVVASPFALLGHVFGGGEQLAYIEFAPGQVTLDKTAHEKIQTLTKALKERPGLKLDITGRIDPASDPEGLRQVLMERKLKAVKFDDLRREGKTPASLDDVTITPDEYPKLLKRAYGREKFPKPRNVLGFAKSLPVPEMKKLMLDHIVVTKDDLRQLALQRAQAVADEIVKAGGIAPDRVFLLAPKLEGKVAEEGPAKGAKLSRVDFSLK